MAIESWDDIWLRKGLEDTDDTLRLNGYERTSLDPAAVGKAIYEALDLKPGCRLLDVGCGAGAVGSGVLGYCDNVTYVGTERSATLARKHIALLGHSILNFSAHEAVFNDDFFDCCLCYSVFQYFESHEYARAVVGQLVRQARAVYLGDLPMVSHDPTHLLYTQEMCGVWLDQLKARYSGLAWDFSPGLYNPSRFNVMIKRS